MGVEERLERIERLLLLGSKEVLNTSEIALLLGIQDDIRADILSAIGLYNRFGGFGKLLHGLDRRSAIRCFDGDE